jgi:hypothetical protein
MCGQWPPGIGPDPWPPFGGVDGGAGVVVLGVVVVDGVVVVLWVLVVEPSDPLGAAAAAAIPATAPPVASAPATITALMVFALLMRPPVVGLYDAHPPPAP